MADSVLDDVDTIPTWADRVRRISIRDQNRRSIPERKDEIDYQIEKLKHYSDLCFRNRILLHVDCNICRGSFVEFKGGYILRDKLFLNYQCENCGHDWSDVQHIKGH